MSTETIPGKLVDAVFKTVFEEDLTPTLVAGLEALGIHINTAAPMSYPRSTWYRAIELTASTLYPSLDEPTRLRKLGKHMVASLQTRGIVKGAFITMARFLGPRRALKQAVDHLDRSPVKITITEKSKTEFEIGVDDREQTDFLAGMLGEAIEMLGGKSAEVALKSTNAEGSVFKATWR